MGLCDGRNVTPGLQLPLNDSSFHGMKHRDILAQIPAESHPQFELQDVMQKMSSGLLGNHQGLDIWVPAGKQ